MKHAQFLWIVSAIWVCGLCGGCGRGDGVKRTDISGSATFAGSPIVYGTIEFIPDEKKGNSGPTGAAEIINGKYNTKEKGGRGVVKGPHHVRITAYSEAPKPNNDETKVVPQPEPLFVGYLLEADLGSPTQDFNVPEGAKGFNQLAEKKSGQGANAP